jgi:hypothetical protein
MGDGVVCGEVTRGFAGVATGREPGDEASWAGLLLLAAGELLAFIEPNSTGGFPPTGPPFSICPLVPVALMVTEAFRPCSFCVIALLPTLPLAMVGAPKAGAAGEIDCWPFMDDLSPDLPFAAAGDVRPVLRANCLFCAVAWLRPCADATAGGDTVPLVETADEGTGAAG